MRRCMGCSRCTTCAERRFRQTCGTPGDPSTRPVQQSMAVLGVGALFPARRQPSEAAVLQDTAQPPEAAVPVPGGFVVLLPTRWVVERTRA